MFWDIQFKRYQGPIHNLQDRNALNLFPLCKRRERTSTVQTQIGRNVTFVTQNVNNQIFSYYLYI